MQQAMLNKKPERQLAVARQVSRLLHDVPVWTPIPQVFAVARPDFVRTQFCEIRRNRVEPSLMAQGVTVVHLPKLFDVDDQLPKAASSAPGRPRPIRQSVAVAVWPLSPATEQEAIIPIDRRRARSAIAVCRTLGAVMYVSGDPFLRATRWGRSHF